MEEKLNLAVVAAQAEAVFGCAVGLEKNIEDFPVELRAGIKVAVHVLKSTAEGMMLEAVFQQ